MALFTTIHLSTYHIIDVQDDRLVCHHGHQDVLPLRPFFSSGLPSPAHPPTPFRRCEIQTLALQK